MSKETFKAFVRNHPELALAVNNRKTSWQNLYETFDLYGENSNVWDHFKKTENQTGKMSNFQEMINAFKSIDLDTFQKGINGLEKGVDLLRGLITNNDEAVDTYEERPIRRYFED